MLERFDRLLEIVEWHETAPRGTPHTFEVILPLVVEGGTAPGGRRATAAFAEQVIREISRTKPLREHFTLIQKLTAEAAVGIQGAARIAGLLRAPMEITIDESQPWASLLQDENGDPMKTNGEASAEQLRLLLERIERIEEEERGIADDKKDVFAEAKAMGFDVKTMRTILKLRRMESHHREEAEAVLETYLVSLGMK